MRSPRCLTAILGLSIVAAGCADPSAPESPLLEAAFIVNGMPDGDDHPNVGVSAIDRNGDGVLDPFTEGSCSGFLIAPTVFLGAAHCMGGPSPSIVKRWVVFDTYPWGGSFNAIPVTEIHRHPQFGIVPGNDMGVMLLESSPPGVDPVELPNKGLLDRLVRKHDDAGPDLSFTTVGYGVGLVQVPGSICIIFPRYPNCFWVDGRRRSAVSGFEALDEYWLYLNQDPALGYGGACLGDSGAPRFLGDTNLAVAVTTGIRGSSPCTGISFDSRLDTKSARDFLKQFLDDDDDDDDQGDDDDDGQGGV